MKNGTPTQLHVFNINLADVLTVPSTRESSKRLELLGCIGKRRRELVQPFFIFKTR